MKAVVCTCCQESSIVLGWWDDSHIAVTTEMLQLWQRPYSWPRSRSILLLQPQFWWNIQTFLASWNVMPNQSNPPIKLVSPCHWKLCCLEYHFHAVPSRFVAQLHFAEPVHFAAGPLGKGLAVGTGRDRSEAGALGVFKNKEINVNPGLINPKRLFNWGDTI